ncbi:MAG: hypothetical protein FJ110_11795 [Deltaproteobacteria bacterium]|nr:hypothetical protein [Deltaproteobacteria bacterium]
MQKMKRHITSSVALSIGFFGLSLILSGAPMRVHLVDALSFVIAFTIPAAHITELEDVKKKWKRIVVYWFSGTIVWFFMIPLVVVKADLNVQRLALLLGSSFIGLMVFIALHLLILRISPENKTRENIA